MKKRMFHRCLRRLRWIYLKNEELLLKQSLGCCGKNVKIDMPVTAIGHPERIEIGDDTEFCTGARLQVYPDYCGEETCNPHIRIGRGCFFCFRTTILAGADITIGNNVLFGSDITVTSERHGTIINGIPYMEQPLQAKPIVIGDNVWVGDKVVILPGVKIGSNCVIGAGTIVTKDVSDECVVVGNPGRVIKRWNSERKDWISV